MKLEELIKLHPFGTKFRRKCWDSNYYIQPMLVGGSLTWVSQFKSPGFNSVTVSWERDFSYDDFEVFKELVVHTGYVNVFQSNNDIFVGHLWKTREHAEEAETAGRIACIKITITEGEGL